MSLEREGVPGRADPRTDSIDMGCDWGWVDCADAFGAGGLGGDGSGIGTRDEGDMFAGERQKADGVFKQM